jgi:hypothetical protein
MLCFLAFVLLDAVQAYWRTTDPFKAYDYNRSDGVAAAKVWTSRSSSSVSYKPTGVEMRAAEESFFASPLNPNLLSMLALTYALDGQSKRADDLMAVALRASRRDAVANLWMIEKAIQSNDIKAAVSHYDDLLSVHTEMWPTLFPVISAALRYNEVRKAIAPYFKARSNWGTPLLDYASRTTDPESYFYVAAGLRSSESDTIRLGSNLRVARKLLVLGKRGKADRLMAATLGPPSLAQFKAFAPNPLNANPTWDGALSWRFTQNGDIQSERLGDDGFITTLQPLSRGVVAARELVVEPGSSIELLQSLVVEERASQPELVLKAICLNDQGAVGQFEGGIKSREWINVPRNCNLMSISWTILGIDSQMPSTVIIRGLAIRRAVPSQK